MNEWIHRNRLDGRFNLTILVRIKKKYTQDNSKSEWQLQEAKASFSEVVRHARKRPQRVTLHGKPAAVVVSAEYFERMMPQSGQDLVDLIHAAHLQDIEFGKRGEAMPVREVDL